MNGVMGHPCRKGVQQGARIYRMELYQRRLLGAPVHSSQGRTARPFTIWSTVRPGFTPPPRHCMPAMSTWEMDGLIPACSLRGVFTDDGGRCAGEDCTAIRSRDSVARACLAATRWGGWPYNDGVGVGWCPIYRILMANPIACCHARAVSRQRGNSWPRWVAACINAVSCAG